MTSDSSVLDQIQSWVLSGGKWRLADVSPAHAVVNLCTCTGELMERLETSEPSVIESLRVARAEDGEVPVAGGADCGG